MCLLLMKDITTIQVAQSRAQAQAALGGDEAVSAFKDYYKLAYRTEQQEKEQEALMRERAKAIAMMGPVSFTPEAHYITQADGLIPRR